MRRYFSFENMEKIKKKKRQDSEEVSLGTVTIPFFKHYYPSKMAKTMTTTTLTTTNESEKDASFFPLNADPMPRSLVMFVYQLSPRRSADESAKENEGNGTNDERTGREDGQRSEGDERAPAATEHGGGSGGGIVEAAKFDAGLPSVTWQYRREDERDSLNVDVFVQTVTSEMLKIRMYDHQTECQK